MHRGCVVSKSAIKNEDDSEPSHIEVAMLIEEVTTGQVLFSEHRRVEAMEKEPMSVGAH